MIHDLTRDLDACCRIAVNVIIIAWLIFITYFSITQLNAVLSKMDNHIKISRDHWESISENQRIIIRNQVLSGQAK